MCYCPTPTLHLNLALTGDGAISIFPQKKTHSVWFISVLNYEDTENVLINHLLLVIPMSYPCHYTNLCPHKPHKHAHTHTHTHHTHRHTHTHTLTHHTHTHTTHTQHTHTHRHAHTYTHTHIHSHTHTHTHTHTLTGFWNVIVKLSLKAAFIGRWNTMSRAMLCSHAEASCRVLCWNAHIEQGLQKFRRGVTQI